MMKPAMCSSNATPPHLNPSLPSQSGMGCEMSFTFIESLDPAASKTLYEIYLTHIPVIPSSKLGSQQGYVPSTFCCAIQWTNQMTLRQNPFVLQVG